MQTVSKKKKVIKQESFQNFFTHSFSQCNDDNRDNKLDTTIMNISDCFARHARYCLENIIRALSVRKKERGRGQPVSINRVTIFKNNT